jgi:hypothetical protein
MRFLIAPVDLRMRDRNTPGCSNFNPGYHPPNSSWRSIATRGSVGFRIARCTRGARRSATRATCFGSGCTVRVSCGIIASASRGSSCCSVEIGSDRRRGVRRHIKDDLIREVSRRADPDDTSVHVDRGRSLGGRRQISIGCQEKAEKHTADENEISDDRHEPPLIEPYGEPASQREFSAIVPPRLRFWRRYPFE